MTRADTAKLIAGLTFTTVLAGLFVWQAYQAPYTISWRTLGALLVLIWALFGLDPDILGMFLGGGRGGNNGGGGA